MLPRKATIVITGFMLLALAASAFGVRPVGHTGKRRAHVRHARYRFNPALWNPLFRPTRESMVLQNSQINEMQLPRIKNDSELEALKVSGDLIPLRESEYVHISGALPVNRRYARPWTVNFVEDLGKAYFAEFGVPIQVNSAVRTVQVQRRLRRRNRNAAAESGELASSHLAGVTVDLQRGGLTKAQHIWLEDYFANLKTLGLIEPEEERRHYCFHVMVNQSYDNWREEPVSAEGTP